MHRCQIEAIRSETIAVPGIWHVTRVVSQNGIHHGRHQTLCHQAQVLTLVHKGLNQLQSDLRLHSMHESG